MDQKNNAKVQIFTSPTCHYCHAAKEFMDAKGVAYDEFDVLSNVDKRQEMMEKSGQMGVPVIIVGDEVMVGFDEEHLAKVLDKSASK